MSLLAHRVVSVMLVRPAVRMAPMARLRSPAMTWGPDLVLVVRRLRGRGCRVANAGTRRPSGFGPGGQARGVVGCGQDLDGAPFDAAVTAVGSVWPTGTSFQENRTRVVSGRRRRCDADVHRCTARWIAGSMETVGARSQ